MLNHQDKRQGYSHRYINNIISISMDIADCRMVKRKLANPKATSTDNCVRPSVRILLSERLSLCRSLVESIFPAHLVLGKVVVVVDYVLVGPVVRQIRLGRLAHRRACVKEV